MTTRRRGKPIQMTEQEMSPEDLTTEQRKKRAYDEKYRAEHQEELRAYFRQYRFDHLEEKKAKAKAYYLANKQRLQAKQRKYNRGHTKDWKNWQNARMKAVWNEIFRIYGDSCSCCGTKTRYFLTIHHIHGREEEEKNTDRYSVWKRAVEVRDPKAYRILCFNCHLGGVHHNHGVCPHRGRKRVNEWDDYGDGS